MQAAFAERLQQNKGIVFKVAAAYSRSPADRDDLAQSIALEAWRGFPRFDASRRFSTWLYRIALNVAISSLRKERRDADRIVHIEQPLLEQLPQPAVQEGAERAQLLRDLLEPLTPLDRALMILYLEDQPYAAIAEILGISETNVATKIARLKQRIRREAQAQNA